MKHGLQKICCLLFFLLLLSPLCAGQARAAAQEGGDFRAVWVSTVLNLDYPAAPTPDAAELSRMADEILDGAVDMGFNAVILQVRPASDAIYQSDIFPWSHYLTGEAGKAPDGGFDPLAYWVEAAHARGLELHAWINPYRITKNTAEHTIETLDQLPEGSPAREHPEWAVKYGGDFYFDPALPEVRALVTNGVREILENYDVDGIHLDDYFYPGQDFDDSASYAAYGEGRGLADWRRENVNMLIRDLHDAVSEHPGALFGVSPAGIWANRATDERGSATSGGEAYTQHYADTRLWVEEAMLDYICPQIYWHIGHARADYAELVSWWSALCRDSSVQLYIGMAAYRVDGEDEADAWQGYGEILRQLDLNRKTAGIDGVVLFRYGSLAENAPLADAVGAWFASHHVYPLAVCLPERDLTTDLASYYIGGSSAVGHELTCNGTPVEGVSESGFFGIHAALDYGPNIFEFVQNGITVRRTITCVAKLPDYGTAGAVTSAFPTSNYYSLPGYHIELRCTAPVGASVKAEFGGRTYVLYPDRYPSSQDSSADTTVFRAAVMLPGRSDGLDDLGAPVYTMRWRGERQRVAAAGHLYLVRDGEALTAQMEGPVYAYESASFSGGCINEYAAGMKDNVSYISGAFLKLSSGYWVSAQDVTVQRGAITAHTVKSVSHTIYKGYEQITLHKKGGAAGYASYDADARTVTLRVSPAENAPELTLRQGSLFSSCAASVEDGCAVYRLTLREDAALGGFYTEPAKNGVALIVREKRGTADGAYPLSAHTIVIDAGHGGASTGTLGLLGAAYPEKDANLDLASALAEKLRGLGATVIETRTDDTDVSLEERVSVSRAARPDLFLSIHCNNLASDADMTTVEGFSAYYREPVSRSAAETLFETCLSETSGDERGLHEQNLYVCRGSWCPAVLFETAFMSNPRDFERLSSSAWRDAMTDALVRGVLAYFS